MPWNVCYNNHFTKDNYQTSRAHPLSSGCCCRYLYTCVSHESAQFHLQDKLMPPTSVSHNFADVFVAIYRRALLKILVIGGQTLASIFPSSNWQQITSLFMQQPTEKPLKCFPHTVNCSSTKLLPHRNTSYTEYCTSICGYKKIIQLRIKLLGRGIQQQLIDCQLYQTLHHLLARKLVKVPSIALQALGLASGLICIDSM